MGDLQNYPTEAYGLPDLSRQQQQQMAGVVAEQRAASDAQDQERGRKLDPYEKHHADVLHRLLFGQEDPAAIAADHFRLNPARMGQPGVAPAQNPGFSNTNAPDVRSVPVPNGMNGLQSPPLSYGDQPLQRGAGPGQPRMSMAGAQPGAQPMDPNSPQTKGDLDALMAFAHSGVPGALARQKSSAEGDALKLQIATMLEGGRTTRAAQSEAGKTERQGRSLETKRELTTQTEEGKDRRSGAHETNFVNANKARVAATYYGIDKRMQEVEMRISHAKSSKDIAAAKAELDSLDKEYKDTADNEAKMLKGAGDLMATPEGAAAMKAHAEELAKTHNELSARVDAARSKLAGMSAKGGGEESSVSVKRRMPGPSSEGSPDDELLATPGTIAGPGSGNQTDAQLKAKGYVWDPAAHKYKLKQKKK